MTGKKEDKGKTFNQKEFIPECARHYANANGFPLPKKIKDDQTLFEIVREAIVEKYKAEGVKAGDRYHCEDCGKVVQEPDLYCWCCGTDLSDDKENPGGWENEKKKKITVVDNSTKKKSADKPADKGGPTTHDSSGSRSLKDRADATGWNLKQYTSEIRRLHGSTGQAAWQIGRRLREIEKLKKFQEGSYQTMQEYVESELSYKWPTARQFMKGSAVVEEKIAAKVGVFTLQLFARTPQKILPKVIKAALPKDEGGKGLNRDQLEEFLKSEKDKVGKKSNAGRPIGNPYRRLIGQSVTIRIQGWEEGENGLVALKSEGNVTKTGVEAVIQQSSIRINFVELE